MPRDCMRKHTSTLSRLSAYRHRISKNGLRERGRAVGLSAQAEFQIASTPSGSFRSTGRFRQGGAVAESAANAHCGGQAGETGAMTRDLDELLAIWPVRLSSVSAPPRSMVGPLISRFPWPEGRARSRSCVLAGLPGTAAHCQMRQIAGQFHPN